VDNGSIQRFGRRELEINDTSIESMYLASRRASAELSRRKNPKQRIRFSTLTPVTPGETLGLAFPSFDVEGTFVVQRVTTSAWLPVEYGTKLFLYDIECVNALSRDWIDFLRELARKQKKIDPSEGDDIQDVVGHDEEVGIADTHTIKTPTAHAEAMELADSHSTHAVASGGWKWNNDAGTIEDGARWGLNDMA
jgi:hypothetical protein